MPPKARQIPRNSTEQEGRVLLAIKSIQKKEISNIREAARIYNVPRTTLQRRLNGHGFRAEQRANSHKLTQNEEESIVRWILSLDQRGAAPRPSYVQEIANILLSKRGDTNVKTVGVNWTTNFIKEWFDRVQITIMQHGIPYEDIYNFDETGYAMGLVATAKVVTRAEMVGKPFLVQPGNQEWVTSIECINSSGWALPPCVIFKGKVHIEGWYQDEALPRDWRIEVSQNGWTTDEIGLRWLQKLFIPATNGRTAGKYRLLILDGHGSHLTPHFDEICSQNDIIPICMPPHSSHLLQPLDVGCFSPLKRAYGRLVENKARLGFNHIDKFDFLEAYPEARMEAFKADTIKNGFTAAGLVPFNPERVLEQLNIQLKTPTPPGSQSTNSAPKTLYNPKQLEKQASTIKKLLRERTCSPSTPTKSALGQLIKGCEIAVNSAALLAKENLDLRATNEKRLQKRKRSKKQIARTEGLSVQEGQELLQSENEAQQAQDTVHMEPTAPAVGRSVRGATTM